MSTKLFVMAEDRGPARWLGLALTTAWGSHFLLRLGPVALLWRSNRTLPCSMASTAWLTTHVDDPSSDPRPFEKLGRECWHWLTADGNPLSWRK